MATVNGAKALGLGGKTGQLAQGMAGGRVWQRIKPLPAADRVTLSEADLDLEVGIRDRAIILRKDGPGRR